jgi:DNA-binding NtrC family response regulator
MGGPCRILVAESEGRASNSVGACLRAHGFAVDDASDGSQVVEMARQQDYSVYFIDLKMAGSMDGLETVRQLHGLRRNASIVIIIPPPEVEAAITALKQGAQAYITRPCNQEEVLLLARRMIQLYALQRENARLQEELQRNGGLLGKEGAPGAALDSATWTPPAGATLQEMEKRLVTVTIRHTGGNIKEAASILGIDRSTLYEKIKRYAIPR